MTSTWQTYAQQLADAMTEQGVLAPGWREAFANTPRHVFVPFFYDGETSVAADTQDGLRRVYADESLVTQLAPDPRGGDFAWPTSSSTRPSLMARMLTLLEVSDGERVLEIGTGTGYNAALLSYRLGDRNVTSIDIDPQLVATAKARLAGIGHRPHLASGDGALGVPERAPYERIIATAAVGSIPPTWIGQLVHGGRIVADVRGELASALLVADKTTTTSVRGRFRDIPGHFMWLRARADNPLRGGVTSAEAFDFTDPQHATTDDIPADAFDDRDFRFVLQLAVPGLGPVGKQAPDGSPGVFLHTEDDRSWMTYRPTGECAGEIEYGGPRPLWPEIADLWQRWHRWNLPAIKRFGMTCYDDGRSHVWLDHEHAIVLSHKPHEA